MKDFITQYSFLQKEASRYLDALYKLQEEFDIPLDLGSVERSYGFNSFVLDGSVLKIQIEKQGWDWGGISDDLITMPDCVDTKISELRKYCIDRKEKELQERRERQARMLKESEENDFNTYLKLKEKFDV